MDIYFSDPTEIPLPPEEVRIRTLSAEPWPDGRKIRVYLEFDPSQKRPSAELTLINPEGECISTISVIESMTRKVEINMHLRSTPLNGQYTLEAVLFFDQILPETEPEQPPQIDRMIVDKSQFTFSYTH